MNTKIYIPLLAGAVAFLSTTTSTLAQTITIAGTKTDGTAFHQGVFSKCGTVGS